MRLPAPSPARYGYTKGMMLLFFSGLCAWAALYLWSIVPFSAPQTVIVLAAKEHIARGAPFDSGKFIALEILQNDTPKNSVRPDRSRELQGRILARNLAPSEILTLDDFEDEATTALLEPLRDKHKVPGLIGAILKGDQLVAIGAVGVRKLGSPERMAINDKMHIGSCTKAMTATRLALLVEEKKLRWDTTIAEVFPELAQAMHPDYRGVQLSQLLTHRAGLPANVDWWDLGKEQPTPEQRRTLLVRVLKEPPDNKPGTKFAYSNVGYVIAAAMMEKVTTTSWEELMRCGLFQPLGMSSAGFGVPGTIGEVEQPWGHQVEDGKLRAIQADNAPVLGPAGTVHCSVADWAKFIALHLKGAQRKSGWLKPETFTLLHTPPQGRDYAFGWVAVERDWAGGTALTHAGSNTMWYATVWMAPKRNFAVLVTANRGDDAGKEACDEAASALIDRFDKEFAR